MERSSARGDLRARVGTAVVLGAAVLAAYTAAIRFSDGAVPLATLLGASALAFGLAWLALRGRSTGTWICIVAVALLGSSSSAVTVLTGGASIGALIMMTFTPILGTFLVSPRLGASVAAATCVALVVAAAVPPQIRSPALPLGATDTLVAVGVLTLCFWAVAAYYAKGRRAAYREMSELREEVERTAGRFRAYTENARDIIVEVADDGMILYASPGHDTLLGRPPSALLGGSKTRNLHPEDLPRVEEFFKAVVAGDETASVSARYVRPDESLCWLELRGRYFKNSDGQGRVLLYARDETAEREAADEREALIARLQEAIDSIETLRGIVPICAECKNVRREDGAWEQIEEYVAAHSLADFSHGLCDACLARYDL